MDRCYVVFKAYGRFIRKEEILAASLNQVTAERELQELAEECAKSLRRQGCQDATAVVTPARGFEPLAATIVGIPGNVSFFIREVPLTS